MSTPPGHKELWKNIGWKNDEEKLAFYNKYFKNTDIEHNVIKIALKQFKVSIVEFINRGKIGHDKEERQITLEDVKERILRE